MVAVFVALGDNEHQGIVPVGGASYHELPPVAFVSAIHIFTCRAGGAALQCGYARPPQDWNARQ